MVDFNRLRKMMVDALAKDKTAHDPHHVLRVLGFAEEIAKNEPEADMEILRAAALLHDIAYKEGFFRGEHGDVSAKIAEPMLRAVDFPLSKIPRVLQAIELHNWFFHFEKNVPVEVKILRDADRLDALGKHAIERATLFYGKDGLAKGIQRNIDATEDKFETNRGARIGTELIKELRIALKSIADSD